MLCLEATQNIVKHFEWQFLMWKFLQLHSHKLATVWQIISDGMALYLQLR